MKFYEPVAVDQIERDRFDYTMRNITVEMPFNVIAWSSPPPNTTWEIYSMQIELNTTANVGGRNVYQYFMDESTATMRFCAFGSLAGFANKCVCQYGIPGITSLTSGIERTMAAPLYCPTLDPPNRIGALLADFDGGDSARYHLLVRESTKL